MISTRSFLNQVWIDLSMPTEEEVNSLLLSENLNAYAAKDMLTPTPIQSVRDIGESLYAVLHIPAFKHSHGVSERNIQEIDFVISSKGVITARYDSIDALHYFAKQIEVEKILGKGESSHIFFAMMKEIYKGLGDELSYMDDWMSEIEKNIFSGREKEMVSTISTASRNLLNFNKTLEPQRDVIEFLKTKGGEKFGRQFEKEASDLFEEWRRLANKIESHIDFINELRETNNSLLSTKQNEIMKIFTIMAFVTFPLSLVAAIFGMNASFMPIVGKAGDFWIIISIMFCISLMMFIYFRHKKWI